MTKPRGDFQLALGYWIVSHREQLRKWWVLALLGFTGLSLIWAVIFFTAFFAQQPKTDSLVSGAGAAVSELQLPSSVLPQELEFSPVSVVSRSPLTVDLVAFVTNPNTLWGAATLTYHFQLDDQVLTEQTAFVNVGDDRPLLRLNVPVSQAIEEATIVVDDVVWERSARAVLTTPNFSVSDITLTQTNVTLGGQTFLTYNVKATITNRSVFNFLRVEVPIVLRSGERIVAVDRLVIDRWGTLTEKAVDHTISYPVGQVGQANFDPQASQFDTTNLFQ